MLRRQMFLLSHAMVAGMLMWERLWMKLVEGIEEGLREWTLSSAQFLQSLAAEIEHGLAM